MPNYDITIGERSEATGRFNFVRGDDGDVAFDITGGHAVVTSAVEALGSWWADPQHGCEVRSIKSLTQNTPSQVEAMTVSSLKPLEDAGEIVDVVVTAEAERSAGQRTGRLIRRIRWTTPSGQPGDQKVR